MNITTHERVIALRFRYERLIDVPHPEVIDPHRIEELLTENNRLPHSDEQQKLEDDMLARWQKLHRTECEQ